MKIANIGFLLTIKVLQAVSHPSDWKGVQAGSLASVNQQISNKTAEQRAHYTGEKYLGPLHSLCGGNSVLSSIKCTYK